VTFASGDFNTATFYTYDVHGNVGELLQDYGSGSNAATANVMNARNRYKKLVYEYDLMSGKVNKVAYQPGMADQFFHKYNYDAENRLTEVYTSADDVLWERDAAYMYYRHGPLARMVLGQQQVQGVDYAYTVQGWVKGVNSSAVGSASVSGCVQGSGLANLQVSDRSADGTPAVYEAQQQVELLPGFTSADGDVLSVQVNATLVPCQPAAGAYYAGDMGADGSAGSPVARDAMGYQLNYYRGDYTAIGGSSAFVSLPAGNLPTLADNVQTGADLFNGNIGSMLVNIPKLGDARLYGYRYDQLNRIVAMNSYTGFSGSNNTLTPQVGEEYKERISYDPNGNILTYLRNGNNARLAMDNMTYSYVSGSNKLDKVVDAATDAAASEYDKYGDIKQGQNNSNYTYDAIGNLVKDVQEGITNIEWTVYGKIASISKLVGTTTTNITYTYDAGGNRISKKVVTATGTTTTTQHTWYVRDASGNVMAVYEQTDNANLTQTEVHLYGSSRLGIWRSSRNVNLADLTRPKDNAGIGYEGRLERGYKFFELSNHLGNVLVTVSDRKLQFAATLNSTVVGYYLPDLVTANDYYPFGMGMPGRKFSASGAYRYGFNGKENDNDVKGQGNQQDYGMRIYDPRIGKFLSVDPLTGEYPELTPYQFASNSPIDAIDLDGLEAVFVNKRTGERKTGPVWPGSVPAKDGWVDG
jgi:RHS repeat-associated protein